MIDRYFGISSRITKWKESSLFEQEMSDSAQSNFESRRLYCEYYKNIDPVYYERGKEFAQKLIKENCLDFEGSTFEDIYNDMVYCLHRYGLSFQDYLIYNLYNKSEYSRGQFVSDKLRYYYCDILNGPDVYNLMTDKLKCYEEYNRFYKREVIPVINQEDKSGFLKFVSLHRNFIYKPLNEHSGHGITIINSSEVDPQKWFEEKIQTGPGIIEELIMQGETLNIINPNSINSCRVLTFRIDREVTIIGVTLRMGDGRGITDNAGAGGIFASVNPQTGIIQSDAKNYKNQHFNFHPFTGTQIIGYKLPDWEDALNMIREIVLQREDTTMISWDIAYSNKGWLLVEANDNGDWSLIQSNFELGKKKELYNLKDKYFEIKSKSR